MTRLFCIETIQPQSFSKLLLTGIIILLNDLIWIIIEFMIEKKKKKTKLS